MRRLLTVNVFDCIYSPVHREASSSPQNFEGVSSPARKMENSPEETAVSADETREKMSAKLYHEELIQRILENRRQLMETHQNQDSSCESPNSSPRNKSSLPYSFSQQIFSEPLLSSSPNSTASSVPTMLPRPTHPLMNPLFAQPLKSNELEMMMQNYQREILRLRAVSTINSLGKYLKNLKEIGGT